MKLMGAAFSMGKPCSEYIMTRWDEYEGKKSPKIKALVWTTTDITFSLELFYELMDIIRETNDAEPELRQELLKIKGVQMEIDIAGTKFPFERKTISEVMEISRKSAPDSVFTIPEDYDRKEHLTRDDI